MEAGKSGLPIISFDCPTGPSEVIKSGVNGLLIEAYNTDKMAEAIISLIENSEQRLKMSEMAASAILPYEKENIIGKWVDLINNL